MSDRQLIADLLSALEYHTEQTRPIEFSKVAIEAAREYLRQPEQPMHPEIKKMYEDYFDKCFRESSPTQQEPVAWGVFEGNLHDMFFSQSEAQEMADLKGTHAEVRPLYTSPPQRPWVGLTDEEWDEICLGDESIARAIEAKLKEKNT